jgi:hypothetical protein
MKLKGDLKELHAAADASGLSPEFWALLDRLETAEALLLETAEALLQQCDARFCAYINGRKMVRTDRDALRAKITDHLGKRHALYGTR